MAVQPAVSDVLNSITSDIKTIVRGEIELAKAEMVPQVKQAGIGAGMFGAAGYLALNGAMLIYIALGFVASGLYQLVMPAVWAYACGFATIALVFLAVAGVLVGVGKGKFQFTGPDRTIAGAEQSVAAVQTAVSRGQANVAAMTPSNARPTPELQDASR